MNNKNLEERLNKYGGIEELDKTILELSRILGNVSIDSMVNTIKTNFINKQVIRDKIEELDKEYNKKVNEVYKNPTEALIEFQRVVGAKKILEELLESEE